MYVPRLLNDHALGLMLAINTRHARRLMRSRALPVVVLAKGVERVTAEDVERFIAARRRNAADGAPSPSGSQDDSSPVPPVQCVCDDATHRQTAAGEPVAESNTRRRKDG